MKMQYEKDGKIHRVVYIDYCDGIPDTVVTTAFICTADKPYWRVYHWDFFANDGDKTDIRSFEAGSGGSFEDGISAPQWADGYLGLFWAASDLQLNGTPKNAKRIKQPKIIKGWNTSSINPFKVSEETCSYDYCEECGHNSVDTCWQHKYVDEQGDMKYKSDNRPAD